MTIGRHTGAPRLIEWTGERCVPWTPDVQVLYEHLHRYLWAEQLIGGRRVLDLASGEGFGAAVLARSAESVLGIDVDEQAVDHSVLNYGSSRVSFRVGDAQDLSSLADQSFGAVLAFEMIEHVARQEDVLAEIARVLEPGGLLIMSTPDRRAYGSALQDANPFHVRELDLDEFRVLLEAEFRHLRIWGQRAITGSTLSALSGAETSSHDGGSTFFVEPDGDSWATTDGMSPLYLIAVASREALPEIASHSTLADCDLGLLRALEREKVESIQAIGNAAAERDRASAERERAGQEVIDALTADAGRLAAVVSERDVVRQSDLVRISELTGARERAHEDIERLGRELEAQRQVAAAREAELALVVGSLTWRLAIAARRRLWALFGGPRTLRTRATRALLHGASRRAAGRAAPPAPSPAPAPPVASDAVVPVAVPIVRLPEFPEPKVSLVVPVYSAPGLTLACLRAIAEHTSHVSYEVIVVDDHADEETKLALDAVAGARVLVNETNLGYLRSVNRGAAAARGEWIVLCNNDIEVTEGWLQALVQTAESEPDIGIVTPKYLYPNGLLNEAGGVIWRDGTGANYGRGHRADIFHFRFRRDVDYGSAAALLVKASLWREIGGYDERYAPMYYEDADLCFAAREHGMRVVYAPGAEVVHVEGGTAGTDPATGHKRYQEINREKFVAKWATQLSRDQRVADPRVVREAANRNRGPRVLIVDYRMPRWDRDAGSLRMRAIIESLIKLGRQVTFLPDDLVALEPYRSVLEEMGVEVWTGELNIDAELHAIGPQLEMVLACRPVTVSRWLDLLRERAPGVPVLYDTVDLHWLREARRAGLAGDDDAAAHTLAHGSRADALHELETALIRAVDGTIAVSDADRERIREDVPAARVWIAPTVNEPRTVIPPRTRREGILFVGGFEHPPNIDAVTRLVDDVMPAVWAQLPDTTVTIVGGSPPAEVAALASARVEVAGWVSEVEPYLDRAVAMVAPLTFGAGLKGKITQALAAGVPVVTTTIGAEGLAAADGRELFVADDDEELARRIVTLCTDAGCWSTMSQSGHRLAEARFSPRVMDVTLAEIIADLPSIRAELKGAAMAAGGSRST